MSEEFLSPDGRADYLGVPTSSVYRWRHTGSGPRSLKVGRHVRYRRSDVDSWLDAQADQPRTVA